MKINKMRFGAIASLLLLFGLVQNVSAQTIHIGLLTEGGTNLATNNIAFFVSEHPEYTWDNVSSNATLNAMSVADLIATYDILVVPWQINSTANLDWDTRILPFIAAGGGVLWEDPLNVGDGDLGASGVALTASTGIYPGIGGDDISLVPPFDSNGANGVYHIHYGITGHNVDWFPFSTDIDGGIHGVGGEFGLGRMLIGVSDNLYHPRMSDPSDPSYDSVGAYNLLVNEIFWLRTGSVTGHATPDEHIPVPTLSQWSFILLFVLLAFVGATRLRRTRN
jgi:hypothetical protein